MLIIFCFSPALILTAWAFHSNSASYVLRRKFWVIARRGSRATLRFRMHRLHMYGWGRARHFKKDVAAIGNIFSSTSRDLCDVLRKSWRPDLFPRSKGLVDMETAWRRSSTFRCQQSNPYLAPLKIPDSLIFVLLEAQDRLYIKFRNCISRNCPIITYSPCLTIPFRFSQWSVYYLRH